MKKIFAIALAIVMTLGVVLGCGGNKKETPAAPQTKITQSQNDKQAGTGKVKENVKKEKKNGQQQKEINKAVLPGNAGTQAKVSVEKGKAYTDKDHVAAYIHVYKTLPPNYITKGQAAKLGWKSKGTLDKVAPGKSIGGDRFGNYEKILPDKQGRSWKECDIDYVRGNRGPKRICFSNDGLIYYSGSHYRNFERMY